MYLIDTSAKNFVRFSCRLQGLRTNGTLPFPRMGALVFYRFEDILSVRKKIICHTDGSNNSVAAVHFIHLKNLLSQLARGATFAACSHFFTHGTLSQLERTRFSFPVPHHKQDPDACFRIGNCNLPQITT